MCDFFGNKLAIGDTCCILAGGNSRYLVKAKVIGFAKQMIKVSFRCNGIDQEGARFPAGIVKFIKENV